MAYSFPIELDLLTSAMLTDLLKHGSKRRFFPITIGEEPRCYGFGLIPKAHTVDLEAHTHEIE